MTEQPLIRAHHKKLIVMTILLLQFCLAAWSSWSKSPVYDEPNHLKYGRQIVEQFDFSRISNSKMPVSALNAVTEKAGGMLFPNAGHRARRLFSRLPTLFMAVGITLVVWLWVRRLWGDRAGLAALCMAAFDPNILGHGRWVTTDVPLTFFTILILWQCHLWVQDRRFSRGLICGVCAGGMLLAKFSALVFLPFVILAGLTVFVKEAITADESRYRAIFMGAAKTVAICAVVWVVLWAGYGFQGMDTRAGDPVWKSPDVIAITDAFSRAILPLPGPYLQGLDWCSHDDDLPVQVYFCGKIFTDPVRGYFPLLMMLKTPLGILLIWFLALVTLRLRDNKHTGIGFSLGPAFIYFLAVVFLLRSQLGIRFMLPVYPLMHVFAARIFSGDARFRLLRIPATAALVWAVLSSLSFFPHFLPYCNELTGGRLGFYRYFADSNSDWGQDREVVGEMDWSGFPEPVSLDPDHPVCGTLCVSINKLVGILGDRRTYRWLRESYAPADHVGYSYLIYNVPHADTRKRLSAREIVPLRVGPDPGEPGFREVIVEGTGQNRYTRSRQVDSIPVLPGNTSYTRYRSPFTLEWDGFIFPDQPMRLLLSTVSDGGSQILINKALVVDNRGGYGARPAAGLVSLQPGIYHLIVNYENRGGDRLFRFRMADPDHPDQPLDLPVYVPQNKF